MKEETTEQNFSSLVDGGSISYVILNASYVTPNLSFFGFDFF